MRPMCDLPVVPICRNPTALSVVPNQRHLAPYPASTRGALRPIVTKRGAGCDGRGGAARRAATVADGEVVWSWRPLAGVKLATMLCIAPMTVTKRSWTPGRARSKPLKPLRGECRNDPTEPVATTLVCSLFPHTRLRARLTPGIPCALCPLRACFLQNLGAIARRENAHACPGCSATAPILRDARRRRAPQDEVCVCGERPAPHGEEARQRRLEP